MLSLKLHKVREGRVSIKEVIKSFFWLVTSYFAFKKLLSHRVGLSDLVPYKIWDWHQGTYFFVSYYLGKRIFIKTDFTCSILFNEILAYHQLMSGTKRGAKMIMAPVFFDNQHNQFIAYEFRREKTLYDYIQNAERFCLSYKIIIEIIENLFRLLDHLYDAQIIHRDIKASNLFVGKEGSLTLFDFSYAVMPSFPNDFSKTIIRDQGDKELLESMGKPAQISLYHWDDAFAIYNLICQIEDAFKVNLFKYRCRAKEMIGRIFYKMV